ncbi:MAG: hypothetical protein LBH21_01515 [Gracilibacteraceae bacterium]|jgi:hypothetical protein|nr:hypothetical protein [Gracilibacteraceae bacterium]
MRKIAPVFILAFCLAAGLPGCAYSPPANETAYIYADFTCANPAADEKSAVRQYEINYAGELTPALLTGALSDLTGLDFFCTAEVSPGAVRVDWNGVSTLIVGLDDRPQKDDFRFEDADSLNWFMMDSLYRTLRANFADCEVYYTMLGGKPLITAGAGQKFPVDEPYRGGVYYLNAQEDPAQTSPDGGVPAAAPNRYIDRRNNITFTYPNTFSLDGRVNSDTGRVEFLSRQEDAVLSFWVEPNEEGETPQEFLDRLPQSDARITWPYDNSDTRVVIFAETASGPNGQQRGRAYQFVVQPERVIGVCVDCAPDRLDYWYSLIGADFSVIELID